MVRALASHRESSLSRGIAFCEFLGPSGQHHHRAIFSPVSFAGDKTTVHGHQKSARRCDCHRQIPTTKVVSRWLTCGSLSGTLSVPHCDIHQLERKRMTTAPANAILFIVLLIAFVIIASLIVQRQRSLRSKRRFGPEYDLTVAEFRIQPGTELERRTRHTTDQESDEHVF